MACNVIVNPVETFRPFGRGHHVDDLIVPRVPDFHFVPVVPALHAIPLARLQVCKETPGECQVKRSLPNGETLWRVDAEQRTIPCCPL